MIKSYFFRFVFYACICVFYLSSVANARNGQDEQPTDPCEILNCFSKFSVEKNDRIYDFASIAAVKMAYSPKYEIEALPKLDLNKCSEAVRKFRKKRGGTLSFNRNNKEKYLEACLNVLSDIPSNIRSTISSSVAILKTGRNLGCNAFIINSKVALTARHCFGKKPSSKKNICKANKISNDILSRTVLSGNDGNHQWSVSGVKVLGDPFDSKSPLFNIMNEQCRFGGTFDFLFITPSSKDQNFPSNHTIEIIGKNEVSKLPVKSRLTLSWFNNGKSPLYADLLGSCLITNQHNDGWFEHFCQALPTSSGAPIFLYQQNEGLKFVGVHVGEPNYVSDSSLGSNTGITIPDEILTELHGFLLQN